MQYYTTVPRYSVLEIVGIIIIITIINQSLMQRNTASQTWVAWTNSG